MLKVRGAVQLCWHRVPFGAGAMCTCVWAGWQGVWGGEGAGVARHPQPWRAQGRGSSCNEPRQRQRCMPTVEDTPGWVVYQILLARGSGAPDSQTAGTLTRAQLGSPLQHQEAFGELLVACCVTDVCIRGRGEVAQGWWRSHRKVQEYLMRGNGGLYVVMYQALWCKRGWAATAPQSTWTPTVRQE